MQKEVITNFPITTYGNLVQYSDTLSKGRCRIFYRGENRNRTYITDEFAEKLLATLAYAPVKGIYEEDDQDYTDHGNKRTEGRIYGIVPNKEEQHFAWEKHIDEDGIEREYACTDVYYYTGLYGEAKIIPGKSQSMELYAPSIKGDWKVINGKKYFVYTEASFLGLQVLGEDVEPCFEGASFFSLYTSLKDVVQKMEYYTQSHNKTEGGQKMPTINYQVSDEQKHNFLFQLLNPNFTEEANYQLDYEIDAVYDSYAIAYNFSEGIFERIYYTKNDQEDSVEITKKERCYIVDVTEEEKTALEKVKALNDGNYTAIDEKFENLQNLTEENSNYSTKINELENNISTLTTERDEVFNQLHICEEEKATVTEQFNATVDSLNAMTAERDALNSFKKNIEEEGKKTIIAGYTDYLSQEILDSYTTNMDQYTAEDLDMKLTYELKKSNPEFFFKDTQRKYVPKDNTPGEQSLEDILNRYKNN